MVKLWFVFEPTDDTDDPNEIGDDMATMLRSRGFNVMFVGHTDTKPPGV